MAGPVLGHRVQRQALAQVGRGAAGQDVAPVVGGAAPGARPDPAGAVGVAERGQHAAVPVVPQDGEVGGQEARTGCRSGSAKSSPVTCATTATSLGVTTGAATGAALRSNLGSYRRIVAQLSLQVGTHDRCRLALGVFTHLTSVQMGVGGASEGVHMSLDEVRPFQDQAGATLETTDLARTWHEQLRDWVAAATEAELSEPNAMVLATDDTDGAPSTRSVLCKTIDARGVVFFTNYTSAKSRDLRTNQNASVTFPWYQLHRRGRTCAAS